MCSLIEVLMPFESFLAVWCSCLSRASWRCGAHAFRERLGSVLQTNQFALMIMQLMRSVWPSVGGGRAANFPWPFEGSWPCSWYGSLATELRRTTSLCCSVGGGECSS